MEILIQDERPDGLHVVLLFGLGMIGSAIRDALQRLQFRVAQSIAMDWGDAVARAQAFDVIRKMCIGLAPSPGRISMVWSAGRTNFFSTDEEIHTENESFTEAMQLAQSLKDELDATRMHVHFLSSAGGLFEGQRVVNRASEPAPHRPYGRMKWHQERELFETLDAGETSVYRPSSVYGPMVRPRKHGLINHLVNNASNRRITVLDAHVMALRDYVYSGDVGEFIARRITFSDSGTIRTPVNFMVSGRCASIFEVVARIERVMKLRVRYRFDESFGNSANITFSDRVLPAAWRPSTLEVGIRQFMLRDRPQTRPISPDPANFP